MDDGGEVLEEGAFVFVVGPVAVATEKTAGGCENFVSSVVFRKRLSLF